MRRLKRWKKIQDFPLYSVSNFGEVRRDTATHYGQAGRLLSPAVTGKGKYKSVVIYKNGKGKSMQIHLLVLEAFAGPRPKGKECNHKDGCKTNNYYRNLEWVTRSENAKHAFAIGLRNNKGEKHPIVKLKESEVWLIKKLIRSRKVTLTKIAKMFKVHNGTIGSIKSGKSWSWI